MAISVAELTAKLVADTSDFTSKMAAAEKNSQSFSDKIGGIGKSMESFGKTMSTHVTLPLVGAFAFAIHGMNENQKSMSQTEAVLKSTGGAAKVTADHVSDLAGNLSMLSGVDDDVIQSGENMLLTFTNIKNGVGKGNDVFDQATKTVLDMSVALGEDTPAAAMQLGKALNDPIQGVTALRRVGVAFTDQQTAQIKKMVEAGDTMGAQKMILAELGKEFGGSAAAAGNTFAGSMGKLKTSLENAAGSLIEGLLPSMNSLVGYLQKGVAWFSALSGPTKTMIAGFALAAAAAGPLVTAVGALVTVAAFLISPIGLVVVGVAALAAGLIYAYKHSEAFRATIQAAARFITGTAWPAIKSFATNVTQAFGALAAWVSGHTDQIKQALRAVGDFLAGTVWPALHKVFTDIGSLFAPLLAAFGSAFGAIKAIVQVAVTVISDLWARFGGQLVDHAVTAFHAFADVAKGAWEIVVGVFRGAVEIIGGVLDLIKAILTGKWGDAWDAAKQIVSGAVDAIKAFVTGGFDVVVGVIEGAMNLISTVIGGAMAAISALWGLMWHAVATAAVALWDNIFQAVAAGWGVIERFFTDTAPAAISAAWSAMWGAVSGAVAGLWQSITGGVTAAWDGLVGFFTNTAPAAISGAWSALWGGVSNAVAGLWSAITGGVRAAWDGLVSFFTDTAPSAISNAWSAIWNGLKAALTGLWSAITSAIHTGWDNEIAFWGGLPKRLADGVGDIFGFLRNLATSLATWIGQKVDDIVRFFLALPGRIGNVGKDILSKIVPDIPGKGIIEGGLHAIGGLFAAGGRPPVGVPSIVGEKGPEWFVPDMPGTVVPKTVDLSKLVPYSPTPPVPFSAMPQPTPTGGGDTYVTNYVTVQATDLIGDSSQVISRIHEGLKAKNRQSGTLGFS